MKTFKRSLSEFNSMHPLLAAPTVGLLTVGMITLVIPDGLEHIHPSWTFMGAALTGGLGQWLRTGTHEDRRNG